MFHKKKTLLVFAKLARCDVPQMRSCEWGIPLQEPISGSGADQ